MRVPPDWDMYKTNQVFEFFKDTDTNLVIHKNRKKLDKHFSKDYYASVYTGGPEKLGKSDGTQNEKAPI